MIDDPYLMNLARITVFALMLHNGVSIPLRDIFSLQRRPALLIRSMGAVLVVGHAGGGTVRRLGAAECVTVLEQDEHARRPPCLG